MPSKCVIDTEGNKRWYQNGLLHRLDGPAVEYVSGDKRWFVNDKLHRLDGPACEYYEGTKFWYRNGLPHRLDGPAIEVSDGTKYWYINGEEYTFKQWLEIVWDTLSIEQQEKYIFNGFEYEE